MALTVSSKRLNDEDSGSGNGLGQRNYSIAFVVDQTDAGALASPLAVLLAAQALSGTARIPETGENYSFDGTTDADSFLLNIIWKRVKSEEIFTRWRYDLQYGPAAEPGVLNIPPLSRPVLYDIDWIEEQVPLENAAVVESLSHVGRAAGSVGPVVNSVGVEYTEAALKTIYYPVLIALKNYATLDEIVALNMAYQGSTNNGTFFGASARKAKYLMTASGGRQQAMGETFYPGTTRIWIKQATWDRKILNNGWGHFEKISGNYVNDANGKPKFFKNKIHDDPAAAAGSDPTLDASEPMNLALDGTLAISNVPAIYLTFRDLVESNYAGIGIGG